MRLNKYLLMTLTLPLVYDLGRVTLEYLREIMEALETIARIGILERIELTQLKKSVTSILSRFNSPGDYGVEKA